MALRQLSRAAGAVCLCDLDPAAGALAIECAAYDRRGRYRLETLIEAHGPRAGLPELRNVLLRGGEYLSSFDPPRPCHARSRNWVPGPHGALLNEIIRSAGAAETVGSIKENTDNLKNHQNTP